MASKSITVRHRAVVITVFPWQHRSGKEYWRFKHDGKAITRSTLAQAKVDALAIARAASLRALDLTTLTPAQATACQRMIEADPTCALVDEFLVWHSKARPRKNCGEAIAEFLAVKRANAGSSHHNVEILRKHLKHLPADSDLCDITVANLPALTGKAARTRDNRRKAWITFFRWCQAREYLPHGERTAPERLERPIITRGTPTTYDRAQLDILFANARPAYRAWLALAAWAGIRTEEVMPQPGSAKSPLMWEDIKFDTDTIRVRAETAKTKRPRPVPMCPALKAILLPLAGEGRIGPMTHPSKPSTPGALAETTRLGQLIGGWKSNALRHSFISYRAAQIGLSFTAAEAGNSETEARRSYNDAKTEAEAEEWFAPIR